MHLLLSGTGQQRQALQRPRQFLPGKVTQHGPHAGRIEHRLGFLDSDPAGGQPKPNPPAVAGVAASGDVAGANEPVDGERHRGGGDAHVPGQIEQAGGLHVIEVIEDAALVKADRPPRRGVFHVAGVTGEEDPWIEVHDALNRVGLHFPVSYPI